MNTINQKLQLLQKKLLTTSEPIKIMTIGSGSVGTYLSDYLVSLADPRLYFTALREKKKIKIHVPGVEGEKGAISIYY